MLTFKDFLVVDLKPGEDEYIKYRNQKRRRGAMSSGEGGPVGEAVEDPCWDGYKQIGTKKKNGKEVPNCVPESFTADVIHALLSEEKDMNKLVVLGRLGLVDNISVFKRILKKLDSEKTLTPEEREVIYKTFNKFADIVTGDDTIYQKVRKIVKEETEELAEGPLVVSKAQANSMLMNFISDALKNGKQADLEKLAAAIGKKMTVKGQKVVFEGEEYDIAEIHEAVIDIRQRIKKKQQIRKMKAKIKMGRRRAMLKRANPEKIKQRAQKRARMAVFRKLAKGKSKSEMSYSERKQVEKRVEAKKGLVKRLMKKLLPKVRKDDQTRKRIVGPHEASQAQRPTTK